MVLVNFWLVSFELPTIGRNLDFLDLDFECLLAIGEYSALYISVRRRYERTSGLQAGTLP